MIDHYASDPAIKDTPRIMRLAGSVSIPTRKKLEKGYVPELVILMKNDAGPYPSNQLATAFPMDKKTGIRGLNLPQWENEHLNLDACLSNIEKGHELHLNALSLAAHYVSMGHGDQDISTRLHDLLSPVSDGGTLGQIQHFIDTARTKFDFPAPSDPAPMISVLEESTLVSLAAMPPLEYDRVRMGQAKELGIRASTLDAEVNNRRPIKDTDAKGKNLELPEPDPWPDPVDGVELLDALVAVLCRYLAMADGAAEAVALWAVHTHALDATTISPRLAITSPEKRCGKSTLISVLQQLVRKPLSASNITAAALFRTIEKAEPTLLIDEADTFLKGNDELRGILNSGHSKFSAHVIRTTGDDHEPRMFTTWAPIAIAMIGRLPGTLEDRSLAIQMRRKRPDESVERFRLDQANLFHDLAGKCARFVSDNCFGLKNTDPDIPRGLHDRAADNWRPLFAIADTAGGEWPELARRIAIRLSAADEDANSASTELLTDIQKLFEDLGTDCLISSEICEYLVKMEDRPWPEWRNGKPITTRQLAQLLKPFGITPDKWREGSKIVLGYTLKDCNDAFSRYLAFLPATTPQTKVINGYSDILSATETDVVADGKSLKPSVSNVCGAVADEIPELG